LSRVFLKEDGRWWYAGGDPDFEPTNELVAGPGSPQDQGKGARKPGGVTSKARKPRAKTPAR